MAAATQVTLAEYLASDYHPDHEYVDGVLLERNAGKRRHSRTQARLVNWLMAHESQYGFEVLTEQRVQTSATHVRIPDICLVTEGDTDEVTQVPPQLCIEILSPDDRWSRVQESINDYLLLGVPEVWVIDPYSGKGWSCTREGGVRPIADNVLRWKDLTLNLRDILPSDTISD